MTIRAARRAMCRLWSSPSWAYPVSVSTAAGVQARKDRCGLSWQIIPRALTEALAAGGGEAKRAFEAMMTMKKIDIAAIEAAQ